MKRTVFLGFEVGTGRDVVIPIQHLAVTGQTQQSGKTTTLEALVHRSGLPAVAFVTKRHEGSFRAGPRMIPPYFRERADWRFVESVLEASMRERMRFERAWIMRAAKGAHTLADVQRNVAELMSTAKRGMDADVYMTLHEYLQQVTPQIAKLGHASKLDLYPGMNIMDLSAYTMEMQALVIRSVIEAIYEGARDTLTVIPEAWEFIPQNRGSPVKLAAEMLIRKGGAGGNYVWLDSQDIAGVHKDILRSVGVWILGVQREINEIKRVLNHIPPGVEKPRAQDIMALERGQFIACFGKRVVKTYVQPAWMTSQLAHRIAIGAASVDDVQQTPVYIHKQEEPQVTPQEAQQLRDENAALKAQVAELTTRIDALTGNLDGPAIPPIKLDEPVPPAAIATPAGDMEAIYRYVKQRATTDVTLLAVITARPEIEVTVQRHKIEIDGSTSRGRIARLLANGFYDEGATNSGTRTELKRTGPDVNNANIGRVLDEFLKLGFFTLESGSYKAVPGMKVNIVEA